MEDENKPNEQEENENKPEVHTAHEIELENQIKELSKQIEALTKTNKDLYLKFGGGDNGNSHDEPTAEEMLTDMVHKYLKEGYNESILNGGIE